MENKVVTDILEEIGGLLDIKGESSFRVQAYYRAASSIKDLNENLLQVYERGELTKIPKIGQSIADKIVEILTEGKCRYLEELRKELPASLLTLMQIPTVGPKTAKLLYDSFGISTIEELKAAVTEGKLREVKHLGVKTEENIIRGIDLLEKSAGRLRLDEASSVADAIISEMRKNPFVENCEPAGSLRRMCETVGDIDILVSSNNSSDVMKYFTSLPIVDYVVALGETKSSILTTTGLSVDMRVIEPKQWGTALQYFTGSKNHNIHLRSIAKSMGYKINEYGVFDEKDKWMTGETEEAIYDLFGMKYIPPVLREDNGEIEAAQQNKLPELVQLDDIKGDLHCHSNYSDGHASIKEMADAAIELGYEYIAITDHARRLYVAGGLTVEDINKRQKEIDELNNKYNGRIRILSGLEVNIDNDGNVDYPDRLLAQLDLIVASIHSGFGQSKEQITKRMLKAMNNRNIHIIAHPTGRLIGKREAYQLDFEKIFKAAKDTATALEVNSFPDRLDLKDEHLRWAKEYGIKFAINTDAHSPKNLTFMKYGIATAQRGWIAPSEVINTFQLDELEKLLT